MTVGVSDEPYSLMLGIAGDICFTMDVLSGVGKFPGFDFWLNCSMLIFIISNYSSIQVLN